MRGARRLDLLANEAVRHEIKESLGLDVVIRRDADQTPFGEFVVFARKTASTARSTLSNSCRRLVPNGRVTWPLTRSSAWPMATLASASEKRSDCATAPPKLLTQEVMFSAKNRPVFDPNGDRQVGIRSRGGRSAAGWRSHGNGKPALCQSRPVIL